MATQLHFVSFFAFLLSGGDGFCSVQTVLSGHKTAQYTLLDSFVRSSPFTRIGCGGRGEKATLYGGDGRRSEETASVVLPSVTGTPGSRLLNGTPSASRRPERDLKERERQQEFLTRIETFLHGVRGENPDTSCLLVKGRNMTPLPLPSSSSSSFSGTEWTWEEFGDFEPEDLPDLTSDGIRHVKTLIFECQSDRSLFGPVVVIVPFERRVDEKKLGAYFGFPHDKYKWRLVSNKSVLHFSGYPPGSIPPLGHSVRMTTIIDASLRNSPFILGGGGAVGVELKVDPKEASRLAHAPFVDIIACSSPSSPVFLPSSTLSSSVDTAVEKQQTGEEDPSSSSPFHVPDFPSRGHSFLFHEEREGDTAAALSGFPSLSPSLPSPTREVQSNKEVAEKDQRREAEENSSLSMSTVSSDYPGKPKTVPESPSGRQRERQRRFLPTVDVFGECVHLVGAVAARRRMARLLAFVDLVPPILENAPAAGAEGTGTHSLTQMHIKQSKYRGRHALNKQSCLTRRAWANPDGSGEPMEVQLIVGQTLRGRWGEEATAEVIRCLKPGHLVYVVGYPRLGRYSEGKGRPVLDLVCAHISFLGEGPVLPAGPPPLSAFPQPDMPGSRRKQSSHLSGRSTGASSSDEEEEEEEVEASLLEEEEDGSETETGSEGPGEMETDSLGDRGVSRSEALKESKTRDDASAVQMTKSRLLSEEEDGNKGTSVFEKREAFSNICECTAVPGVGEGEREESKKGKKRRQVLMGSAVGEERETGGGREMEVFVVDSRESLLEMREFLREEALKAEALGVPLPVGLDCEWQPDTLSKHRREYEQVKRKKREERAESHSVAEENREGDEEESEDRAEVSSDVDRGGGGEEGEPKPFGDTREKEEESQFSKDHKRANPSGVCTIQLAVGSCAFLIDLLLLAPDDDEKGEAGRRKGASEGGGLEDGCNKAERESELEDVAAKSTPELLDETLGEILGSVRFLKVGFQIVHDLHMLAKSRPGFGGLMEVRGAIDLPQMVQYVVPKFMRDRLHGKGLAVHSAVLLGESLDKSEQCSAWAFRPLSDSQISYGAKDAAVLLRLLRILCDETELRAHRKNRNLKGEEKFNAPQCLRRGPLESVQEDFLLLDETADPSLPSSSSSSSPSSSSPSSIAFPLEALSLPATTSAIESLATDFVFVKAERETAESSRKSRVVCHTLSPTHFFADLQPQGMHEPSLLARLKVQRDRMKAPRSKDSKHTRQDDLSPTASAAHHPYFSSQKDSNNVPMVLANAASTGGAGLQPERERAGMWSNFPSLTSVREPKHITGSTTVKRARAQPHAKERRLALDLLSSLDRENPLPSPSKYLLVLPVEAGGRGRQGTAKVKQRRKPGGVKGGGRILQRPTLSGWSRGQSKERYSSETCHAVSTKQIGDSAALQFANALLVFATLRGEVRGDDDEEEGDGSGCLHGEMGDEYPFLIEENGKERGGPRVCSWPVPPSILTRRTERSQLVGDTLGRLCTKSNHILPPPSETVDDLEAQCDADERTRQKEAERGVAGENGKGDREDKTAEEMPVYLFYRWMPSKQKNFPLEEASSEPSATSSVSVSVSSEVPQGNCSGFFFAGRVEVAGVSSSFSPVPEEDTVLSSSVVKDRDGEGLLSGTRQISSLQEGERTMDEEGERAKLRGPRHVPLPRRILWKLVEDSQVFKVPTMEHTGWPEEQGAGKEGDLHRSISTGHTASPEYADTNIEQSSPSWSHAPPQHAVKNSPPRLHLGIRAKDRDSEACEKKSLSAAEAREMERLRLEAWEKAMEVREAEGGGGSGKGAGSAGEGVKRRKKKPKVFLSSALVGLTRRLRGVGIDAEAAADVKLADAVRLALSLEEERVFISEANPRKLAKILSGIPSRFFADTATPNGPTDSQVDPAYYEESLSDSQGEGIEDSLTTDSHAHSPLAPPTVRRRRLAKWLAQLERLCEPEVLQPAASRWSEELAAGPLESGGGPSEEEEERVEEKGGREGKKGGKGLSAGRGERREETGEELPPLVFLENAKVYARLREVLKALQLENSFSEESYCSRCVHCNSNDFVRAHPSELLGSSVPEAVVQRQKEFWRCGGCGRIYWKGSLFFDARRRFREVVQELHSCLRRTQLYLDPRNDMTERRGERLNGRGGALDPFESAFFG
uniref:3'-5' exonuclease domain-containing protein n=1 Tax=Chromera velia CCMP2878 TaxID=1169474 RepID=A0A0G4GT71_9ALVE|eukprot:Cvel_23298.t1-p1 / transcript=Cvel_23298.t1 / gene=Cvel_23298 / organism=Chromera_velia_CCMP2878 / gene_product=Probable exonuclease mut-7 homolog, putative / transcript_product=Probable exonuclease mut-7 homolog, putative / location=Cvel_scaffold2385:4391-22377(-) / protein_length=2145 / sequence_SO=supercontig / SO=protein_coding / is_pseudo=false